VPPAGSARWRGCARPTGWARPTPSRPRAWCARRRAGEGSGVTAYRPPAWLTDLAATLPGVDGDRFSRFLPPPEGGRRHSAVLILFAPGVDEPHDPGATTVVITERAHTMRSHAGQPAFPGGGTEPQDADATATALREAWEEIDLPPATVDVLGTLPTLHIPVSGYDVTPVL